MLFLSDIRKNEYAVYDSDDGTVEWLGYKDIVSLAKRIPLNGVLVVGNNIQVATPVNKDLIRLESSKIGTPFRIKLATNLDWKQCVYGGCNYKDYSTIVYKFIENNSFFNLTNKYILKNQIGFDFDNNNPIEVAKIINSLKKG